MRIKEIVTIYKKIFNKGLNLRLKLESPFCLTDEFCDYFIEKIAGKELQFSQLVGTILDTNRWYFGGDLSIKMLSIPIYLQNMGYYEEHVVLYADIEPYLKNMTLEKLQQLKKYVYELETDDYEEYINLIVNDQAWR
jgi:hypothetical protein